MRTRGLAIIVATFIVLLVVSLAASWGAIWVVNATRAYAVGEGRYSKAQKIAVLNLVRFAYSEQPGDFEAFLNAVSIPRGDRQARLALEGRPVDLADARSGFLIGQNHPDDVGALIGLFRVFSWWQPFAAAIADWHEGDRLVGELMDEGMRLQGLIDEKRLDARARARELALIRQDDERLTERENTFSTHMGEAARGATQLLIIGLGGTMGLLWVGGMAFATRLFRRQLRLDRQLAASQQRFRDYAEVASDWYWEMDTEHHITSLSEQFFAVTQAVRSAVLGRDIAEFVAEYAEPQDAESAAAAVRERRAFRGLRLRYLRDDGSVLYLSFSGKPYSDDGGAYLGYRGIGSDITASVTEGELIAARLNAEAANQAKSSFVAAMSHEIRTPINGVIGTTNLLARTNLDERQGRLVEILLRSGQGLLGLINDILDFSKIEAGHFELGEVEFVPREAIAEVVDLFKEPASSKGLELVYFVDEEVPPIVTGDRDKLRQILVNLVGNALKFTDRGEILVELRVASSDETHLVLDFSVTDTGIGIPLDKHGQVFESFRQVDASLTRSRGGSGLGLAIAKRLVEMMGGEIGIQSEPGLGSCFHFTLRCGRVAHVATKARTLSRPLRVLVLDTNAISAEVTARYLQSWEIDRIVVSTILDAESSAHEAREAELAFDVALIDIKGLGVPGLELASRLRAACGDERPMRIILLTGLDFTMTSAQLGDIDPFAILDKPARPSELFDALAAIAEGAKRYGIAPFYLREISSVDSPQFAARVLLAEDNPTNQEIASGVLELMGCRVLTASNGAAAVEFFRDDPAFDLILMDCEMPEMDGLTAAAQIREIEKARGGHIPIIALTAHALAEVRDRCFDVGMDDFLIKPYDAQKLADTLKRWLEPAPAPVAIDLNAIERIRSIGGKNGKGPLVRAVEKFVVSTPSIVETIHSGTREGDGEAVWRAAHSLKSSSAALGALRLSTLCAEIEATARQGNITRAAELTSTLDAEFDAATKGLAEIAGLGSGKL